MRRRVVPEHIIFIRVKGLEDSAFLELKAASVLENGSFTVCMIRPIIDRGG